jgi:hypothetical protein
VPRALVILCLEAGGTKRDRRELRALPRVAVRDDRLLGLDTALGQERANRLCLVRSALAGVEVGPLEVDGTADVALPRVARIARLPGELSMRAHVENRDPAPGDALRELVRGQWATSSRNETRTRLNS